MSNPSAPEYTYDAEFFRDNFFREFTWLNGFLRNVSRFGAKPALYDSYSGREWTYGEVNAEANKLANAFLRDGANKNDVVMYMLFNSPEFAFSYVATHKTGTISCPINYRLSPGEIALQLEHSEPKFFIFGEEFAETARKAMELSRHKPSRVVLAGNNPREDEILYAKYIESMAEDNPELPFPQDALRETTRLYTSGTTNLAKAVPLNSLNETLSAHDVMIHFPLSSEDRTMNMTPWFHRGGLHSGGITPTLYAGGEVIILREFHPRRCLELTEKKKISFLIGVPSILALLARA
ncbi:MAG: AMP-binding protein, partial [Desulfovibrio sp.]|nr:AMP-binding protein [Desulfovibrio sp.]